MERRLYDIGSILSSANLIKKSYLGRKRYVLEKHVDRVWIRLRQKLRHGDKLQRVDNAPWSNAGSRPFLGFGNTTQPATRCRQSCSPRRQRRFAAHLTQACLTTQVARFHKALHGEAHAPSVDLDLIGPNTSSSRPTTSQHRQCFSQGRPGSRAAHCSRRPRRLLRRR